MAVSSITWPTRLVVPAPVATATVGAVRLMLTPETVGAVNARLASLPAVSRTVPPFKLTWPMVKEPLAKTSVAEVIV